MSASKLIRPDVSYQKSYIEAAYEYIKDGRYEKSFVLNMEADFEGYVKKLKTEKDVAHQKYQEWVEPVPETVLWLVKDDLYIGSVCIRHRLNWHLEKWGGHIHYTIRPSMRGKGFGKKILRKAIPYASHLGVEKALITIITDNNAAEHILKSFGATYWDTTPETDRFPARKRYWLETQ